jgi:hypothetical protein
MIPEFVQPFLWSYDVNALNLVNDKKRIITNVLNLGTKEATDWLFDTYTKKDIKDCLIHPLPGEWNRKSIFYWSFLMNVEPGQINTRTLKHVL